MNYKTAFTRVTRLVTEDVELEQLKSNFSSYKMLSGAINQSLLLI